MILHLFKPSTIKGFLQPGSLLLFFIIGILFSCNSPDPIEFNFAYLPDATNVNEKLVEEFNRQHKGKIKVNLTPGSRVSDQFYHQISKDFSSDNPTMDVIASDVVWTASFATKGLVLDLSRSFYDNYKTENFLEEALNSAVYGFRIWGIPWYTDAGMLFYRKDLLEKNGFKTPPKTFKELMDMSNKIMSEDNINNGFVFQGAVYEGGVTNAVEYIWNAGGSVLIGDISITGSFEHEVIDPNIITVNDEKSIQGLAVAHDLIQLKVSPEAVTGYRELECQEIFASGDAVFMRAWPWAYKEMLASGNAKINADQIGVTNLPVTDPSLKSYSCLGGWNLMIRASLPPEKQDAAATFIRYMTAPAQQKIKAIEGGNLPTLRSLYDDKEILEKVPVIKLGRKIVFNSRTRPVSPYYMEISPKISQVFNQVLQGDIDAREAVLKLEDELEVILVMNR